MGYSTTLNTNGREVYACEISREGCTTYPCRPHRCPWNWCQPYYVCTNCWARPEVKALWTKAGHDKLCKTNAEQYTERQQRENEVLAAGAYVRRSALAAEGDTVHVVFRNKDNEEQGRYMSQKIYSAFNIGEVVTLADFEQEAARRGESLLQAPARFNN